MNWMTIFLITNQLKKLARGFQEDEIVSLVENYLHWEQ